MDPNLQVAVNFMFSRPRTFKSLNTRQAPSDSARTVETEILGCAQKQDVHVCQASHDFKTISG